MAIPFCNWRVKSIYSLSPHFNNLALWYMSTRLRTTAVNQEADTRIVRPLILTSVVSSYHSLLWMGQCLVPIWEIKMWRTRQDPRLV